jgi:hypothetical protein
MTHQQIIKLAAQAESEGNYRYADFLDRELVRVGFGIFKGFGLGAEKGLARGLGKEITEVGIQRAFGEGTEAGTGAALRSMETVAPKSGNLFQEAGGMIFGKGNKVITRTIEELIQAETKINQIITRIAQSSLTKEQEANLAMQLGRLETYLQNLKLQKSPNSPEISKVEQQIAKLNSQLKSDIPEAKLPSTIAQKHLDGQPLTQAEMQLLYKEILKTEPTAFAGKSKMRPSDAYDFLVNGKITNPNMNRILGSAEKFMYAPDFKGSKWGTGLMAAGMGYAALNYGLPLLGAGVAGAQVAGQAAKKAINNAINPNQAASAAGNVQGGSSTYSLSRDNASVGTSQYYANRVPSSTVANNKTKWIKTSDL